MFLHKNLFSDAPVESPLPEGTNEESFKGFLCPHDDSQGPLTFAPFHWSVRPFVTLYGIEFVFSTLPTVFSFPEPKAPGELIVW